MKYDITLKHQTDESFTMRIEIYDPPEQPKATIFGLHGTTETGQDFRTYSEFDKIGESLGCRVVYPTAPKGFWNFWRDSEHRSEANLDVIALNRAIDMWCVGPLLMSGFSSGACFCDFLVAVSGLNRKPNAVLSYAGYLKSGNDCKPLYSFPEESDQVKTNILVVRNYCDKLVNEVSTRQLINEYTKSKYTIQSLFPSPDPSTYPHTWSGTRGHFWDRSINPKVEEFFSAALLN